MHVHSRPHSIPGKIYIYIVQYRMNGARVCMCVQHIEQEIIDKRVRTSIDAKICLQQQYAARAIQEYLFFYRF